MARLLAPFLFLAAIFLSSLIQCLSLFKDEELEKKREDEAEKLLQQIYNESTRKFFNDIRSEISCFWAILGLVAAFASWGAAYILQSKQIDDKEQFVQDLITKLNISLDHPHHGQLHSGSNLERPLDPMWLLVIILLLVAIMTWLSCWLVFKTNHSQHLHHTSMKARKLDTIQ